MISSKQWRREWSPYVAGTQAGRLALLNDMWVLNDWCLRLVLVRNMPLPDELMFRVARHGVLNQSQLAACARRSRQYIVKYILSKGLAGYFEGERVRGILKLDQLEYMIHIVTKLSLYEEISPGEIAALHRCGTIALVSRLTGVSIWTIRRAMKGLPV